MGREATEPLKAPFPYFGGKRRVADLVWSRIGDCDNVIEPFCGSAAFLLARPHPPRIETLNDADPFVANFWRAVRSDPAATARWADWPVNETDLHARHRWLVGVDDRPDTPYLSALHAAGHLPTPHRDRAGEFRRRVRTDPDYYDPKVAGWWCWGLCCWIGGGWCTAHGETADGGRKQTMPQLAQAGKGVTKKGERPEEWNQVPHMSDAGRGVAAAGVHRKRPRISGANGQGGGGDGGCGVNRRLPERMPTVEQCSTGGKGVNGVRLPLGRPQLADGYGIGWGVNSNGALGTCEARLAWLTDWLGRLRDRLRLARVCCGDWSRVCDSDSVTTRLGLTGIFFDPPYGSAAGRDMNIYAVESGTVASDVLAYCLERGADRRYRIALCGYAGEGHEALEAAGWSVVAWKANGGYGNRSSKGKANATKERIWFSPHCLKPDVPNDLFAGVADA